MVNPGRLEFFAAPNAPADHTCLWCDEVFLATDAGSTLTYPTTPGRSMRVWLHSACMYALCHQPEGEPVTDSLFPHVYDAEQAWLSGGRAVINKAAWQQYVAQAGRA